MRLILTCEHAGNLVPSALEACFETAEAQELLNTHRGYDLGALTAAQQLSQLLNAPLYWTSISRLVVEANRSLESEELFSTYVPQDASLRETILNDHYHPYRTSVSGLISQAIAAGEIILHVSVHSFTPNLGEDNRDFDFGVLFDPAVALEADISGRLCELLSSHGFRAFPNRPYLGTDDGFTTHLRRLFPGGSYAGIELEINNIFASLPPDEQYHRCRAVAESIDSAMHAAQVG
jgi:predicted N-formylglutamate amidohydrolase